MGASAFAYNLRNSAMISARVSRMLGKLATGLAHKSLMSDFPDPFARASAGH